MRTQMRSTTRREFLKVTAAGAAAMMSPRLVWGAGTAPDGRPNVLLLMADDQGWQETGYMTPGIITPNLDEIATKTGVQFTRYYSGHARCSPTRACILTGRQSLRTGVRSPGGFIGPGMYKDEHTLAQLFREAGYATGHFGKWHLGSGPGYIPTDRGYDVAAWIGNHYSDNPGFKRDPGDWGKPYKGDSSEATVQAALDFIKPTVAAKKPFFCTIWYGSPHAPYEASKQHRDKYPDSTAADYLAEVTGIDVSVGILRKELEALGVREDTQLWYCSDNGPVPKGTPPAMNASPNKTPVTPRIVGHKKGVAEGGIRMPGLLEWPAMIKENRKIDVPVSGLDFYPMFTAMLGVTPKSAGTLDGEDVMPIVLGKRDDRKKALPFYVTETYPGEAAPKGKPVEPTSALIEKRFKIRCDAGKYNLIDIPADSMEQKDVSKANPEVFGRMKKELEAFHESLAKDAKRHPELLGVKGEQGGDE